MGSRARALADTPRVAAPRGCRGPLHSVQARATRGGAARQCREEGVGETYLEHDLELCAARRTAKEPTGSRQAQETNQHVSCIRARPRKPGIATLDSRRGRGARATVQNTAVQHAYSSSLLHATFSSSAAPYAPLRVFYSESTKPDFTNSPSSWLAEVGEVFGAAAAGWRGVARDAG